tara:strand:- start:15471 stop:15716 length:246 start_codon:yes stop_codon:yes gene_type:complete
MKENTKQDLYKESLSARINRLKQTIQELKKLNSMLIRGINIDDRRAKEMISIRDKKIEKLNNTVCDLTNEVDHWKAVAKLK